MQRGEVFVELDERIERIEVHFRYDEAMVAAIKEIQGRRFHKEERIWSVPMNLLSARDLRKKFPNMTLGPAVKAWAKEAVKLERNLRQLNAASDAELEFTPQVIRDVIAGRPFEHPSLPPGHALRRERAERPYQRADIKMMSMSSCINGNDVGTGKTLEAIGAIYEGQLDPAPILIIAPKRTLNSVWKTEFERFSDYTIWASQIPGERSRFIDDIVTLHEIDDLYSDHMRIGIGLIADELRVEQYYSVKDQKPEQHDPLHACSDYKGNWYKFRNERQKTLFNIEWGAIIIDEFHTTGLPNRNSLFSISVALLNAKRKWPMSGTPIGGKARRLWPILNFLDKREYSSEWAWIDRWLHVTEERVYVRGGRGAMRSVKNVGELKPGIEQEFFEHHRKHLVRRVKKDALPGLPDAVEIIVDTPMEGKQLEEYRTFEEDHEIILEGGGRMSGSIVIAQYTRLRQMANSRLSKAAVDERPIAINDSNKIEHLLGRLDENGIRGTDWEPGARAYVGVLNKDFLTIVCAALKKAGIDLGRLDGGTKPDDADAMVKHFNDGTDKPFVIAMTTQTGGTGLNLETANSAHLLDEPWDPDVTHQFFGRGDRGERTTALKCYIYRTPDSIQEYIAMVAGDKKITNRNILQIARDIQTLRKEEAK